MNSKQRHKHELGQGLLEFALVLPALLLTMMGIADFGRLFAIYSNMFNAAREGTRYGVVNPLDVNGITWKVRDKIDLADPALVDILVYFDSGPDTPEKDVSAVMIGDRVIVSLGYDVEMMTPLIRAIARELHIETVAARTISNMGVGGGSGAPGPPGPTMTPDGTGVPSPTSTPTDGDTPTPTATMTGTPPVSVTPVPDMVPVQIDVPLLDGDMVVTGIGQPGEIVYLRDIQDPALNLSTTVNGDGTFKFNVPNPLVAGHVIAVQGYGTVDYAVVEGTIAPTATPTPTSTPTPTPTPSTQYIDIDPTCGPPGNTTITVSGHLWPTNKGPLTIYWDGGPETSIPASSDFSVDITVNVSSGVHTVEVKTEKQGHKYKDAKTFTAPCQATPTPTPSQPNLVIESIALENQETISTYDPLTFTVAVRNIGAAAANSLFWVDLYVDPNAQSPTPGDLANEVSVAWAAVASLAQNQTISLTLLHQEGFVTTGNHNAYALADTWDQVLESNELDNAGGPVVIAVQQEGVPPTPTPSPTPGGVTPGAISGSTWLFINNDMVPQGRINVYCYDGDVLVAETLSDQDGNYLLEGIPPGTYLVEGRTVISGELFLGSEPNVQVNSGQTTPYVSLFLFSQGPQR